MRLVRIDEQGQISNKSAKPSFLYPLSSILFLFFFSNACGSMPSGVALPQVATESKVRAVYEDPVGQVYLQSADGRLRKRDVPTDTTYVYFNNRLGQISWVDAANPFRPLLYFEDYQIVVFVDRTLSETSRLDLRNVSIIEQAGPVARGLDDQVWVFDAGAFRLRLLDENGRQRLESDDLRRSLGINNSPRSLFARRNWLVAWWPDRGLARFSNVGQFLEWVELPPADGWTWQGQGLLGWLLLEGDEIREMWYWNGEQLQEFNCSSGLRSPRAILLNGCRSW